ncbi:hypothetical protein HK102_008196 [Quaeritorhiza haematococci]|nr:hypothetical protein HK102_008196 [Quaeritorhiza haematococci]
MEATKSAATDAEDVDASASGERTLVDDLLQNDEGVAQKTSDEEARQENGIFRQLDKQKGSDVASQSIKNDAGSYLTEHDNGNQESRSRVFDNENIESDRASTAKPQMSSPRQSKDAPADSEENRESLSEAKTRISQESGLSSIPSSAKGSGSKRPSLSKSSAAQLKHDSRRRSRQMDSPSGSRPTTAKTSLPLSVRHSATSRAGHTSSHHHAAQIRSLSGLSTASTAFPPISGGASTFLTSEIFLAEASSGQRDEEEQKLLHLVKERRQHRSVVVSQSARTTATPSSSSSVRRIRPRTIQSIGGAHENESAIKEGRILGGGQEEGPQGKPFLANNTAKFDGAETREVSSPSSTHNGALASMNDGPGMNPLLDYTQTAIDDVAGQLDLDAVGESEESLLRFGALNLGVVVLKVIEKMDLVPRSLLAGTTDKGTAAPEPTDSQLPCALPDADSAQSRLINGTDEKGPPKSTEENTSELGVAESQIKSALSDGIPLAKTDSEISDLDDDLDDDDDGFPMDNSRKRRSKSNKDASATLSSFPPSLQPSLSDAPSSVATDPASPGQTPLPPPPTSASTSVRATAPESASVAVPTTPTVTDLQKLNQEQSIRIETQVGIITELGRRIQKMQGVITELQKQITTLQQNLASANSEKAAAAQGKADRYGAGNNEAGSNNSNTISQQQQQQQLQLQSQQGRSIAVEDYDDENDENDEEEHGELRETLTLQNDAMEDDYPEVQATHIGLHNPPRIPDGPVSKDTIIEAARMISVRKHFEAPTMLGIGLKTCGLKDEISG